jgi:hypothetical protein
MVYYGLYEYVKRTAIYIFGNFLTSLSTNSFSRRMTFEYNNYKRYLASCNCLDINLFGDIYRTSYQKRTDLRFLSRIYPTMVKAFDVCSTEIHFRMCDITLLFNWK